MTFFEIESSWTQFWPVQNFSHEFPIDLQIARTDFELYDSVEIFTNWIIITFQQRIQNQIVN